MHVGSVPSENSWIDDDAGQQQTQQQQQQPPPPPPIVDGPISRLHRWTQPMTLPAVVELTGKFDTPQLTMETPLFLTNGIGGSDAGAHCSTAVTAIGQHRPTSADWSSALQLGSLETNRARIYSCHSDDDLGKCSIIFQRSFLTF